MSGGGSRLREVRGLIDTGRPLDGDGDAVVAMEQGTDPPSRQGAKAPHHPLVRQVMEKVPKNRG